MLFESLESLARDNSNKGFLVRRICTSGIRLTSFRATFSYATNYFVWFLKLIADILFTGRTLTDMMTSCCFQAKISSAQLTLKTITKFYI
jgi:hypothetical protein